MLGNTWEYDHVLVATGNTVRRIDLISRCLVNVLKQRCNTDLIHCKLKLSRIHPGWYPQSGEETSVHQHADPSTKWDNCRRRKMRRRWIRWRWTGRRRGRISRQTAAACLYAVPELKIENNVYLSCFFWFRKDSFVTSFPNQKIGIADGS